MLVGICLSLSRNYFFPGCGIMINVKDKLGLSCAKMKLNFELVLKLVTTSRVDSGG